jgi:phosphohistidine phosphatase
MRHGEAEMFAVSDESRALTSGGAEKVRLKLTELKPQLNAIDCIIHSPYLRAAQTAEIVAQCLGIKTLIVSEKWTPEANPSEVLASLETFSNLTPLIVTHMPIVSRVEALCCGEPQYPQPFNCAELSCIDADWPGAGLGSSRRNRAI